MASRIHEINRCRRLLNKALIESGSHTSLYGPGMRLAFEILKARREELKKNLAEARAQHAHMKGKA